MSKKNKSGGIVYSTNPHYEYENDQGDLTETLDPEKQNLVIRLDKKQRRGKQVTLVTGFVGNNDDLKELGKVLKSKCGAGGSVKDNEIIIQGEFREKIKQILTGLHYQCKISG